MHILLCSNNVEHIAAVAAYVAVTRETLINKYAYVFDDYWAFCNVGFCVGNKEFCTGLKTDDQQRMCFSCFYVHAEWCRRVHVDM